MKGKVWDDDDLRDIYKKGQQAEQKRILELIDLTFYNMESLVEHQFPDDFVAQKVMTCVLDYKDELKEEINNLK
jgi:hypothetical protein